MTIYLQIKQFQQYQVPNSIKQELEESINDISEQTTQIVYEIDGTDLNNYEKAKDYQKGKVNPFADISQTNTGTTNTSTPNTTNGNTENPNPDTSSDNDVNNNTNNNTNTSKTDSEGSYLPNKGTK